MIPVKGHNGLYRDERTNAIINTNDSVYKDYINSRNRLIENQEKMTTIENELTKIKELLKILLENK
jgi:hypothetical protein